MRTVVRNICTVVEHGKMGLEGVRIRQLVVLNFKTFSFKIYKYAGMHVIAEQFSINGTARGSNL